MLNSDTGFERLKSMSDEELVLLAKGDKSASAVLLSRYSRLIYIKSEIFSRSGADSDDLYQEGLLSLLKAIEAFEPDKGAKFSTFAEVCIVNRMRSVSRKSIRNLSVSGSIEDEEQNDLPSVEETPESIYFYKEFFSELWKNICSELSPTELRTLTLCVGGLSYKEAAEKMNTTEKAVDNAMQRARRKIRAIMGEM